MKKILNKYNSKEEIIEKNDINRNQINLDFFKITEIKHKKFFFSKIIINKNKE